jgi:hypothetical protein
MFKLSLIIGVVLKINVSFQGQYIRLSFSLNFEGM